MPAQSLQTDAFILQKRPAGEAFQGFSAFSAEHGPLHLLQRLPRKAATTSAPLDLFDEVSVLLETSNQGHTWFIKEARLLTRHPGLGGSYETLRLASALAGLIARNVVPEESRPAVATLLREAFTAFATGRRPDIVYFKSLYRFARDEGYPLKQHWLPTLGERDRHEVAGLLRQPLDAQSLAPAEVTRLIHHLEHYLRGHTEVLLD